MQCFLTNPSPKTAVQASTFGSPFSNFSIFLYLVLEFSSGFWFIAPFFFFFIEAIHCTFWKCNFVPTGLTAMNLCVTGHMKMWGPSDPEYNVPLEWSGRSLAAQWDGYKWNFSLPVNWLNRYWKFNPWSSQPSCKLFPYISSGCSSDPTAECCKKGKYSRKLFISIDSSSLMEA